MIEPALHLFDSIKKYNDLENLIEEGESEGLYLECKAPSAPKVNQDIKAHLGKAISGFSNTTGGIIIYGMSTDNHHHSSLDVCTQVEPIGSCVKFEKQIMNIVPTLSTPAITNCRAKSIKIKSSDTKGVVVVYIPKYNGDPVQSASDGHFYFRSGDGFVKAPYEMIKRLFASTKTPDLQISIDDDLVMKDNGIWIIPIVLSNNSSSIAEHIIVNITVENSASCESISSTKDYNDISDLNPGTKVYSSNVKTVIHKGFSLVNGSLKIKMKSNKRTLKIKVEIFADKMRARYTDVTINLTKSGFSVKETSSGFLY